MRFVAGAGFCEQASMDEAEARKAKLQALKERAKRAREGGGEGEDAGPTLKFRNYQPKTEELKDGVVEPVKVSADKELEKMGAVSGCMQRRH